MAHPVDSFRAEATWLEAFFEHRPGEIFFFKSAEEAMRRHNVSRLDVLQIMREGAVVESEKEADGARWCLQGDDCDGRTLWVTLRVDVNAIRVEVVDVIGSERDG